MEGAIARILLLQRRERTAGEKLRVRLAISRVVSILHVLLRLLMVRILRIAVGIQVHVLLRLLVRVRQTGRESMVAVVNWGMGVRKGAVGLERRQVLMIELLHAVCLVLQLRVL